MSDEATCPGVLLDGATVHCKCRHDLSTVTAERDRLRADLIRMDCDWPDFEAMRAELATARADGLEGAKLLAWAGGRVERLHATLAEARWLLVEAADLLSGRDTGGLVPKIRAYLAAHPGPTKEPK